jgi:hypothetical protein
MHDAKTKPKELAASWITTNKGPTIPNGAKQQCFSCNCMETLPGRQKGRVTTSSSGASIIFVIWFLVLQAEEAGAINVS